jgi:hypothetical protein
VNAFAKELHSAEKEFRVADTVEAREATVRVAKASVPGQSITHGELLTAAQAASMVRLRRAKTAVDEARAKAELAAKFEVELENISKASTAMLEAHRDFTEEVIDHLLRLRARLEVIPAADAAWEATTNSLHPDVRAELGLTRPPGTWTGLIGASPAQLVRRIAEVVDERAVAEAMTHMGKAETPNAGRPWPKSFNVQTISRERLPGDTRGLEW